MNKPRRLKRLFRRVERYKRLIKHCQNWIRKDKTEIQRIVKEMRDEELLKYGEMQGYL